MFHLRSGMTLSQLITCVESVFSKMHILGSGRQVFFGEWVGRWVLFRSMHHDSSTAKQSFYKLLMTV